MSRLHARAPAALRPVTIERGCAKHAEGSALVRFGDTQVLCTVSVLEGVPRFLRGKNQGWLTAEYGMLPRSTGSRMEREAVRGKQGGRTLEIQRLIGRSLRAAVDLNRLGELTLQIDCDVLQADGGTRTASITGACVALVDALRRLQRQQALKTDPLTGLVAAVSVGMVAGEAYLDLDYVEDSSADTDLNVVMLEGRGLIEVQGTAEGRAFSETELAAMVALGRAGIEQLFEVQRAALIDA